MSAAARPLLLGNWKMNGSRARLAELTVIARHPALGRTVDVGMALPATLIALASDTGTIQLGAQNVHVADAGAHTGSLSGALLREAGARFTLVGHSERRAAGDTDAVIASRVEAAWRHGLRAVLCVGDSAAERAAGAGEQAVLEQVRAIPRPLGGGLVIAYEPVWCIGAATAATVEDIAAMLRAIRRELRALLGPAGEAVPLLYGGAVDPGNAAAILRIVEVNGVLAGRASLDAESFLALVDACPPPAQADEPYRQDADLPP